MIPGNEMCGQSGLGINKMAFGLLLLIPIPYDVHNGYIVDHYILNDRFTFFY